jgi:hypothetical protein
VFGLIKGCRLKGPQRSEWSTHYCGLCLSLLNGFGHISRLFTNSEGVLISVLCDAQASDPLRKRRHLRPLRRFRSVDVVEPGEEASRYAAAMSLLMAASKILDHVADHQSFIGYLPGPFSMAARRWIESARKSAAKLGVDISPVEAQLNRQIELEKMGKESFLFYSQAVERAAGIVCAHTAAIAGRPGNAAALYDIGTMYGRIIYLVDAYMDYVGDIRAGRFNPLAQSFQLQDMRFRARELFNDAHRIIIDRLGRLKLVRGEFVTSLLAEHLPTLANAAFSAGMLQDSDPIQPGGLGTRRKGSGGASEPGWCSYCDCCDCGSGCDLCSWCDCGGCCDC